MLSDNLTTKKLVIGAKQTLKALADNVILAIYIAEDADGYVLRNILELAQANQVPITYVDSMKKLGKDCGISVGAATVGVLKS